MDIIQPKAALKQQGAASYITHGDTAGVHDYGGCQYTHRCIAKL